MTHSILIVDDTEFMRFVLSELMAENGIGRIFEAGTAAEALSQLTALSPDLAAVDLTSTRYDGLELLKALRGAAPGLKLLGLKRFGDLGTRRRALAAGADIVVAKPFDPVEVQEAIRELLGDVALRI